MREQRTWCVLCRRGYSAWKAGGMDKQHILSEIRRTAAANGGRPLGRARFARETGIRTADWYPVHWIRWGDALAEVGFEANAMQEAYDDECILRALAVLTRELGRIPVEGELRLQRMRDPGFPSKDVFRRLGLRRERLEKLLEYCRSHGDLAYVANIIGSALEKEPTAPSAAGQPPAAARGYVYLPQHGSRPEYKIGRTNNPLRREGEIGIELPEQAKPVHVIETDDAAGVEGYWHRRFAEKRKRGEWFELTADDVRAFKKWQRIA